MLGRAIGLDPTYGIRFFATATSPTISWMATLKYKNIPSAIHNLGHSFTSFANYINDGYIIDDLADIHRKERGIEIDWLAGSFAPDKLASSRIRESISYWHGSVMF
jgi:hypothetical protein